MSQNARYEANALYCAKTDHKAWAKRIIYRHEQRDTSLYFIAVKMAYEAMGREIPQR